MRLTKTLGQVAPGEPIRAELNITCGECGVTSKLIADGFTLEKDELDIEVGRVRFLIRAIYDDILPLCNCILDNLTPIVGLYIDSQHLN
jgi:hypothetical protein